MNDNSYKIVNNITLVLIAIFLLIIASIKFIYADLAFSVEGLCSLLILVSNSVLNLVRNKKLSILFSLYHPFISIINYLFKSIVIYYWRIS